MDPYDGFDVDLIGEAPCEFCEEMWPLALLAEHQSTHLMDPNYYMDNFLDANETENVVAEEISGMVSEPKVATEQLQQSPAPVEPVKPLQQSSTPAEAASSNAKASSPTKQSNSQTKKNEVKKLKTEKREFTTESGEKTIFYGTDMDPEKDFEDAKQSKVASNLLFSSSVCKEEDVEDIHNLSDDDCTESLEEFWKRARDQIRRNKARC